MMLATLFATQQYAKHCSCKQCRNLCSCEDCNKITLYSRIRNTMSVVQTIYETGSLYKTKGENNSIIHYYFKQFYNSVFDKLRCAVHIKQYGCIPAIKPLRFLQNATSSLHISTSSTPSFPRIL